MFNGKVPLIVEPGSAGPVTPLIFIGSPKVLEAKAVISLELGCLIILPALEDPKVAFILKGVLPVLAPLLIVITLLATPIPAKPLKELGLIADRVS